MLILVAAAFMLTQTGAGYPWPRSAEFMTEDAVLVFSKTRDWRHEAGIPAATRFFADLAGHEGLSVHSTEDSRIFNPRDLARFSVVVLNSSTGDVLTPEQERAFQDWTLGGGGVIALHAAGDGSDDSWPWYRAELIGADFAGHAMAPQFQDAELVTLDPSHPVTDGLPLSFRHRDEWYSFRAPPGEGFTPILGLLEESYVQDAAGIWPDTDLIMGPEAADHPIAWTRCVGRGRSVYSGMGHLSSAFDAVEHQMLLANAFRWVRQKNAGGGCPQR